jgi:hypothetical protein
MEVISVEQESIMSLPALEIRISVGYTKNMYLQEYTERSDINLFPCIRTALLM